MKVYSIGREESCNIVLQDRTNVISRRHATLTVMPSGKMTITDLSQNGTYVNGMRISSNVAVPVTRKDTISFAHIVQLDWNQIPQPASKAKYVAIAVVALILIVGAVVGGSNAGLFGGGSGDDAIVAPADTTKKEEPKSEEQIRKEIQDSIQAEKEKQDSIAQAKKDSLNKAKQKPQRPKKDDEGAGDEPTAPADPEKQKGDTTKTKKFRV